VDDPRIVLPKGLVSRLSTRPRANAKFLTVTEEEAQVTKVGLFVTLPNAGVYCRMTLDNGEKILINHDTRGFSAWLTIERSRLLGFSSERIFACNLESDEGRKALSFLTRDTQPQFLDTSPLGAFVRYLKTCHSVDEIKARCTALMAIHGSTAE
jgi:hypothetical protein